VQIYEDRRRLKGKSRRAYRLDQVLKSNRILPKGWRTDGPSPTTRPHGAAEHDSEYINSNGATGADKITYSIPLNDLTRSIISVRVTLNYQAIPPYYLKGGSRLEKAPRRKARLLNPIFDAAGHTNRKLETGKPVRGFEDTKSQACSKW
jgi:hypothetical protein